MEFLFFLGGNTHDKLPPSISHACDDRTCVKHPVVANGPNDGAGLIVAPESWRNHSHRIGYHRSTQTWQPMGVDGIWIGHENESTPGPHDLQRDDEELTAGHWVKLGDGNEWLVPVARKYAPNWPTPLTRSMSIDSLGNWCKGPVIAKYRDLYTIAGKWLDFIIQSQKPAANVAADVEEDSQEKEDKQSIVITDAELADWCVMALAINYRVSRVECAMLGLLNESTMIDIMHATIDFPFARELQKKRQALGQ